ncbi:hypothetical protein BDC45DRAFT_26091 [Circinella umbellata]|nr:hypothetical protein BDC45DRAFT_26091 [Circinella umbellata]
MMERSQGFVQAGSFFPDWGYQCLGYNQQSEDAHWAPFIHTAIDYIKETYPSPRSSKDPHVEGLVSFLFAIMSHDVADVRWHSLQGLKNYFIEAMAQMDFDGDYAKAHMAADTGAEFTLQHSSTLDYINATWHVPVQDIVHIYTRLYQQHDNQQKIPSSDHLIYCMTSAFAASRIDLELGRFLFSYYGSKSPFLIKELVDYYKGGKKQKLMFLISYSSIKYLIKKHSIISARGGGYALHMIGLQDMSASVAECHMDMINAFENNNDGLLCGSYFEDSNIHKKIYHDYRMQSAEARMKKLDGIQHMMNESVTKSFDAENGVLTLSFIPKSSSSSSLLFKSDESLSYDTYPIVSRTTQQKQQQQQQQQSLIQKNLFNIQLPSIVTQRYFENRKSRRNICTDFGQEKNNNPQQPRTGTAITLSLPESSAGLGHATTIGDFDGDGEYELIISAPYHGQSTQQLMSGTVFVLNGTNTLLNYKRQQPSSDVHDSLTDEVDDIRDASRVVLAGPDKRGRFGWSMATVDLNQDGIDDLAIASPFSNDNQGRIDIFFGRKHTGIGSKPDVKIQLPHTEGYGFVIAGLDMNQDGHKDLVVGCPYCTVAGKQQAGAVHVFLGSNDYQQQSSNINRADISIYSTIPTSFEHFGTSFEFSSPSSSSHISLLLVGAPGYNVDKNIIRAGRVYAFQIKPWLSLSWTMDGKSKFQHFGSMVMLNKSHQLLAISSPSEETKKGLVRLWQAGTVRVYDWVELQKMTSQRVDLKEHLVYQMDGQQSAGHLGRSLAFFDAGLWVGEPMANGERGRVHRWKFNDNSVSCIKNANAMGRFGSHIQTINNDILGITSQYFSQGAR